MTEPSDPELSHGAISQALTRVLASAEFEGADRPKEFLSHVVNEALAGRGGQILGKHILQDVYDKNHDGGSETANVVRVDAGRLRRRLEGYYAGSGADDSLRIHIDKGGYSPRFERSPQVHSDRDVEPPKVGAMSARLVGYLLKGAAIVAVSFALWPDARSTDQSVSGAMERAERAALFEKSLGSLQAVNMAEEARDVMFPATEPVRVKAALALFEQAIQLDDTYYGGFAGAAQVTSILGGLSPSGPERDAFLARAREYGEMAVDIAPTRAWSQSAMAFVEFVERDYDAANRLSVRAVVLEPNDLYTLEIDAIIALFSGEFDRAIQSAAPEKHTDRSGSHFPWRNAQGNAQFHLRNYELAIKFMMDAALNGEPVSEFNTAHLIAAYQASGRAREASNTVHLLEKSWPKSRVDSMLRTIFQNPEDAENVISRMQDAGWRPQELE